FAAQTFVAVARDAMDPCDLRQHHGDHAITDLIDSRIPLFEFVIRKAIDVHDLSTAEGRSAATRAAGTVLNALEDQSLREAYAAQVAHWVQLDKALVERTVSTVRAHTSEHTTTPTTAASSHLDRERAVLALIIQHPALARAAGADRLTGESFTDPDLRHV